MTSNKGKHSQIVVYRTRTSPTLISKIQTSHRIFSTASRSTIGSRASYVPRSEGGNIGVNLDTARCEFHVVEIPKIILVGVNVQIASADDLYLPELYSVIVSLLVVRPSP